MPRALLLLILALAADAAQERRPPADGGQARRSSVSAGHLDAELRHEYPGRIVEVTVAADAIRVRGHTGGATGPVQLAEEPMDRLVDDPGRFETVTPVAAGGDGKFTITLPRIRERSGLAYDRLTSRWRLVTGPGDRLQPHSHARYADQVATRSPAPAPATLRGKKGLGGWHAGRIPGELRTLGIHAVTVNLIVDSLLADAPSEETIPHTWQGRILPIRRSALSQHDATFLEAAKHGAMVSVILLVANPARHGGTSRLAHPGATSEGVYAMPDLVSENGIAAYGGVLDFMAERWSRADGKFGRVHHWIVHNEVDFGWEWTNAGKLPALSYMDLYQRSLRLTDLIARQYDPHSRAFISLTHHWAHPGSALGYGSRQMLELLGRFTAAEGDFPWALAYHPYPQDLRNPRTWEDRQPDFTFDTPKITPRNIEVLDAWMKRPEMLYRGAVRPVHLSENGFNSPDYSARTLAAQAAGMAYAWKKIQPLETILVWHYHAWIDNRQEGGLRLGLRRFPDDPDAPLAPKPIWPLYQALGTPGEGAACAPYLQTIGIADWSAVLHQGPIR